MKYTMDLVHEGYLSNSDKKIGVLNNAIWQFPFKDFEEVIWKANRYSNLGSHKLKARGVSGGVFKAYYHGLWSFIKHYFLKFGFLDGGPGLVIAIGNFEGTFYRYIKLLELEAESNKLWQAPQVKEINKKT